MENWHCLLQILSWSQGRFSVFLRPPCWGTAGSQKSLWVFWCRLPASEWGSVSQGWKAQPLSDRLRVCVSPLPSCDLGDDLTSQSSAFSL